MMIDRYSPLFRCKKFVPVLLFLIILTGCGAKYLTVSYLPPAPANLNGPPVTVVVTDQRADKAIVSPALQAKGVFAGSARKLDIEVTGPDGLSNRMLEVSLEKAVGEAVKARLRSAGFRTSDRTFGSTPDPSPYRLAIDIRQFYMDLDGRRITAQVAFGATSYKQGKEIFKEEINGQSQRVHLLGASEEEKALSQALANAVNSMSLGSFSN